MPSYSLKSRGNFGWVGLGLTGPPSARRRRRATFWATLRRIDWGSVVQSMDGCGPLQSDCVEQVPRGGPSFGGGGWPQRGVMGQGAGGRRDMRVFCMVGSSAGGARRRRPPPRRTSAAAPRPHPTSCRPFPHSCRPFPHSIGLALVLSFQACLPRRAHEQATGNAPVAGFLAHLSDGGRGR